MSRDDQHIARVQTRGGAERMPDQRLGDRLAFAPATNLFLLDDETGVIAEGLRNHPPSSWQRRGCPVLCCDLEHIGQEQMDTRPDGSSASFVRLCGGGGIMDGMQLNFQKNGMPSITPITATASAIWSCPTANPKQWSPPKVQLELNQLETGRHYAVWMTTEEARKLARDLESAATSAEVNGSRPEPMF